MPLRSEYHRKKTKKNVFDMLYFLNFMIKLNMTLVVYAIATYFVDACIIFLRVVNGVYECHIFCVKIWVITLAIGTNDNTIKRILLLMNKDGGTGGAIVPIAPLTEVNGTLTGLFSQGSTVRTIRHHLRSAPLLP